MPVSPIPTPDRSPLEPAPDPALLDQLRALRVALAVVQHGTTVRAGEAIHLSQPAVARAVAQLEGVCGLPLFTRAARGMMPTPAGTQLAQRVAVMQEHLVSAAIEARAAATPPRTDAAPRRFAAVAMPSHLRALLAVASCGSEARAAASLGVTQPAVHAALSELERLLGVPLFHPLKSGTRLRPAGEALLRRVKLAVAEVRGMESDIGAWRGEIRGRIVVGVLPLSVPIFLPRAVEALAAAHPQIEMRIVDGTYESLMQALLCADIDAIAGALRSNEPADEVRLHPLFEDDLVVVARAGHPSLGQVPRSLRELLRWDWVSPLPGTPADRALDQLFVSEGLPPPSGRLRASSPALTQAFVLQTGRLALASRGQALLHDHGGQLCIVPLARARPLTRRAIGVATRAFGAPSQDLRLFLDACSQVAQTLPLPS